MAGFPMLMPTSISIRVGTEYRSPYQWAAEFAPDKDLVQYKDAMLWLEGEEFATKELFLAKVKKVLEFQQKERLVTFASTPIPTPVQEEESESESEAETVKPTSTSSKLSSSSSTWKTVKTSTPKRKKKVAVSLTRQQLAYAIVEACIKELKRVFSFTGPSLRISDVYAQFDRNEFTYPQLIGAVRDQIEGFASPSVEGFPVGKKARYWAETGPGKGKNFNFKVWVPNSNTKSGWSAAAQIHVLWQ